MDELFDEVDDADRPTGRTISKHEAHAAGHLHRCVAIYVFDEAGSLYVQVHKKSGGRLDHSVGGHVRSGETYLEAAHREMYEELGLSDVPVTEEIKSFRPTGGRFNHMFTVYTCTAPRGWHFSPNDEVSELQKVTVADLARDITNHPEKYTSGIIGTFGLLYS